MRNNILIIGVGSIGKILLDVLIKKNLFDGYHLMDGDIIKKHNHVYNKKFLNVKKVLACKEEYNQFNIYPIDEYLTKENLKQYQKLFKDIKYIFDCRDIFDNNILSNSIKLYINNDRLFINVINKNLFKYEFKSDYIAYTNLTTIHLLINNFVKNLKKYVNQLNYNSLMINTIGNVQHLESSKYIFSKKNIRKVKQIIHENNIKLIDVNIYDGIYNIFQEKYNLIDYNISNIFNNVEKKCYHFPSNFLMYQLNNNELKISIYNQIGGA